jgi:hypothetical protein
VRVAAQATRNVGAPSQIRSTSRPAPAMLDAIHARAYADKLAKAAANA